MSCTSAPTRPVTLWLYTCCGMIFVMALLGAITRLTESGLSITRWEPVMGALPPLNEAAWSKAFADYQTIPQYQILHHGMSLEAFKHIYFWEWFHRLWGRLIGVVFALPLIGFLVTKKITPALFGKLAAIFALGGVQGFIGWFMVQSGLAVRTSVSPYRLALHLGFALLLYGLLLWTALGGKRSAVPLPSGEGLGAGYKSGSSPTPSLNTLATTTPPLTPPRRGGEFDRAGGINFSMKPPLLHGWFTLALLALTMIWGAFVAGLHAGGVYNTWPLMEGDWLPDAAWSLQPAWINFFENTALAQFTHRWLAPTTLLVILAWVARCWRGADPVRRRTLLALGIIAGAQIALGLATLLTQVNIVIAVLHQAGAITLLTLLLVNLRGMTPERK